MSTLPPEYKPAARAVAATVGPIVRAVNPDIKEYILDAFEQGDHAFADSWWCRDGLKVAAALHEELAGPAWPSARSEMVTAAAMHACLICEAPLSAGTVREVADTAARWWVADDKSKPEPKKEAKFIELVWNR